MEAGDKVIVKNRISLLFECECIIEYALETMPKLYKLINGDGMWGWFNELEFTK